MVLAAMEEILMILPFFILMHIFQDALEAEEGRIEVGGKDRVHSSTSVFSTKFPREADPGAVHRMSIRRRPESLAH